MKKRIEYHLTRDELNNLILLALGEDPSQEVHFNIVSTYGQQLSFISELNIVIRKRNCDK